MTVGNKVTANKYNKNDRNGNQLTEVNRYEIPKAKKGKPYIDVTLGSSRLNINIVNHYNAENQLVRTLTKNHKVSFIYDVDGLRTSKTVNGEKTACVWDGDQLVLELGTDGKVKKRYVRGSVPKGKYFNNFVDAAIDALKEKNSYRKQYKLSAKSKDLPAMFSYAERYNGLGYYKRGVNSPYI